MNSVGDLLSEGTKYSTREEARRYNLLAGKLIADLIKSSFGPRGFEKMYIDLLGEVTITKNGSTILRKLDVEHPAAKVMIDASNSVDNEVGDGTISVVILAGSLLEKEEKPGNTSDIELVRGVVIDKTIDNSAMPRLIEKAKILLTNEELDNERTKTDAEIIINNPQEMQMYLSKENDYVKEKAQKIIDSGANVVISQKGISLLAQHYLSRAGIISLRRVKENDLHWLEKAVGASITIDLDNITEKHLGFAGKVYEKFVGDDKMVFVEECRNPKSVTILLRANSKRILDEYHRSVLDAIAVLKDFFLNPSIVAGGGSTEIIIANELRKRSLSIEGREQIVIQNFAEALEEIPLTIARNSGMNIVDTIVQLRSKNSEHKNGRLNLCNGVDEIERKLKKMY